MATINGVAIMDTEDESSAERLSHEDDSDHDTSQQQQQQLGPRTLGGLIPLLVGFSCILGAVLVAFSLQITSTVVYCLAVILYHICRILPSFSLWTAILYVVPVSLLVLFRALDLLLLIMDTVLVEILAALAYVICTPLAFSHAVGFFYHQQTRKLPHYVRWACRKPWAQAGIQPPRAACFVCGTPLPAQTTNTTTSSTAYLEDNRRIPGRAWSHDVDDDSMTIS